MVSPTILVSSCSDSLPPSLMYLSCKLYQGTQLAWQSNLSPSLLSQVWLCALFNLIELCPIPSLCYPQHARKQINEKNKGGFDPDQFRHTVHSITLPFNNTSINNSVGIRNKGLVLKNSCLFSSSCWTHASLSTLFWLFVSQKYFLR